MADWNGQSGSLPAIQYGQGRRSTGNPFLDALLTGQPIYSNPPQNSALGTQNQPTAPTVPNFSDITAQQGVLAKQQAGMDPERLVGARAKNEADQANFAKQLAILHAMQTPQMDFQDFNPQTPYPEMQFPGIPQRQTPSVNPLVSALAGLGGIAAPMYGGQFQANASQGAINQSNLQYGDQQTAYNQQLQQLQQHHMDLLNARNEQIKYAYDNLRGKERAKYLNAIADRDAQLQQVPLQGQAAGAGVEGQALAPGGEISQNTLGHQGIEAQLASLAAQHQAREEAFKNAADIYKSEMGYAGKMGVAQTSAGAKVEGANIGAGAKKYSSDNTLAGTKYRADTQQEIGRAHDVAAFNRTAAVNKTRVDVANIKANSPDKLLQRTTLDAQLRNAGTSLRSAQKELSQFLIIHPDPDERSSDPNLKSQYEDILGRIGTYKGQEETFNNALTELRKAGGKTNTPPAAPLTGQGWSLTPKK